MSEIESGAPATPLLAVHEEGSSCAALFIGNQLEYAAAEERFSRDRFHWGQPKRTLADIRLRYGITQETASGVVVANQFGFLPSLPLPAIPHGELDSLSAVRKTYLRYQSWLADSPRFAAIARYLTRKLAGLRYPRLASVVDHHTAHAYSAYMTSGFATATAITVDGFGDGFSSKVFRCDAGRCKELYSVSAANSLGVFYEEIANLVGVDARLGGKVTGMAAYGDARVAYPLLEQMIQLQADHRGFVRPRLGSARRDRSPYTELAQMRREDLAAAGQKRLEDLALPYVSRALEETGISDLVLAGGVFGNVKLVQRIVELASVGRVFVHPAMSDHGIAVGAGFEFLARERGARPNRLAHVFLGPDFSDEQCARALDELRLPYREEKDIDARVASLLAEGKLVARFCGRMEYGPRALGNRSILYRSDDPSVNTWLNQMLNRKEYMPFAPSTLSEAAERCYGDFSKAAECLRFMTTALPCTEFMLSTSPGAVHIDGTARPHVVWENDNPAYYRILKHYEERTGIPTLINTSFNMHEEPIVCTPEDACRAFVAGRLPFLAINRFLVQRSGE